MVYGDSTLVTTGAQSVGYNLTNNARTRSTSCANPLAVARGAYTQNVTLTTIC